MTPSKKVLWGVVVVLVALLLISATAAAVYYGKYETAASQNRTYAQELETALDSYRSLQSSNNATLAGFNQTLTLLAAAVANLNTSTPAYVEASVALSSLWGEYQSLARAAGRQAPSYDVHMLLDYGNGTKVWYNDTTAQPGWNGYVVTLVLLDGKVQATWYPQYGEHLVSGLGGVQDSQTEYWFLLTYNETSSWQLAQVGADLVPVVNGTTFAWVFCAENSNYGPSCPLP